MRTTFLKAIGVFGVGLAVAAVFSGSVRAAQINTFGKLVISADDNSFIARVIGELQVDGNFYHSGSGNRTLTSGTFVRRARIGVMGNFREYEYKWLFDDAADQASLEDAYIRRKIGPGKWTVGQFKVMEDIEELNSSSDLVLMERPYASQTAPGFKIGTAYNATFGMIGYSGTVYNYVEAVTAAGKPSNDGVGAVARVYVAPVNQKEVAYHVGASYGYINTDTIGDKNSVRPLGRAEIYRNEEPFKFTMYDRKDERAQIDRFILETAAINGPLHVQAEYLAGGARTRTRAEDTFEAWYVQTSYALTGEPRKYNFREGSVERLLPSRASGAVEIAARYQQARRIKVAGAKLTSTEFGVTYYANANVRFMVNYGWSDNQLINDKPRLLSTRAQFDF